MVNSFSRIALLCLSICIPVFSHASSCASTLTHIGNTIATTGDGIANENLPWMNATWLKSSLGEPLVMQNGAGQTQYKWHCDEGNFLTVAVDRAGNILSMDGQYSSEDGGGLIALALPPHVVAAPNPVIEAEKKAAADAKRKAQAEKMALAKEAALAKAQARAKIHADEKAKAELKAAETAQLAAEAKAKAELAAKERAEEKAKIALSIKTKQDHDKLLAEQAAKTKAAEAKEKAIEHAKLTTEAQADAKLKADAAKAMAIAKKAAADNDKAKLTAAAEAKVKLAEQAKIDSLAKAKVEADAKAQKAAAIKAHMEADFKAKLAAKEKADAEAKAKAAVAAQAIQAAKVQQVAAAQAKLADAKAKAEADNKAKEAASAKAKLEEEAQVKEVAAAKAKSAAAAQAQQVAKAQLAADDKASALKKSEDAAAKATLAAEAKTQQIADAQQVAKDKAAATADTQQAVKDSVVAVADANTQHTDQADAERDKAVGNNVAADANGKLAATSAHNVSAGSLTKPSLPTPSVVRDEPTDNVSFANSDDNAKQSGVNTKTDNDARLTAQAQAIVDKAKADMQAQLKANQSASPLTSPLAPVTLPVPAATGAASGQTKALSVTTAGASQPTEPSVKRLPAEDPSSASTVSSAGKSTSTTSVQLGDAAHATPSVNDTANSSANHSPATAPKNNVDAFIAKALQNSQTDFSNWFDVKLESNDALMTDAVERIQHYYASLRACQPGSYSYPKVNPSLAMVGNPALFVLAHATISKSGSTCVVKTSVEINHTDNNTVCRFSRSHLAFFTDAQAKAFLTNKQINIDTDPKLVQVLQQCQTDPVQIAKATALATAFFDKLKMCTPSTSKTFRPDPIAKANHTPGPAFYITQRSEILGRKGKQCEVTNVTDISGLEIKTKCLYSPESLVYLSDKLAKRLISNYSLPTGSVASVPSAEEVAGISKVNSECMQVS